MAEENIKNTLSLFAFIGDQNIFNQTAVMHIVQITADQGFIAIETTQNFYPAVYDLAAAYHAKTRLALRCQNENSRHAAAFDDGRGRYQQPTGTRFHVENRAG